MRLKGAARETCKETLLRKASEADAHVVSFGTRVGGLWPSDTSYGIVIDIPKRFAANNEAAKRFLYANFAIWCAAFGGLSVLCLQILISSAFQGC